MLRDVFNRQPELEGGGDVGRGGGGETGRGLSLLPPKLYTRKQKLK